MDMEESAEESNAGGEQYEEEIVPKIITDEVYEEVSNRTNTIIRDLQNSKQYLIAEDIQKLMLVCQNLKQNIYDEREKVEQMRNEVTSAQSKVQHAVKMSRQDQEVIQQLKSEIGDDNRFCTARLSFLCHLIIQFIYFFSCLLHQINHGRKLTHHRVVNKSHKKP